MKYLVIFAVAFVVVQGAEIPSEEKHRIHQVHEKCQQNPSTKLSDEVFNKLVGGSFDPSLPNLKNHLFCMSKGVGFQDEQGHFKFDFIKEKLYVIKPKDVVDAAVSKCCVEKATPEDTALHMYHCWHDENIHYH